MGIPGGTPLDKPLRIVVTGGGGNRIQGTPEVAMVTGGNVTRGQLSSGASIKVLNPTTPHKIDNYTRWIQTPPHFNSTPGGSEQVRITKPDANGNFTITFHTPNGPVTKKFETDWDAREVAGGKKPDPNKLYLLTFTPPKPGESFDPTDPNIKISEVTGLQKRGNQYLGRLDTTGPEYGVGHVE